MSLYSCLSGQTGWFQATMSRGLLVAEADLLLDNCSINSEQSWAEFGDGWMHDITATGRDAAAPRIAHHAQERPTSDAGMGQSAQWHFCLSLSSLGWRGCMPAQTLAARQSSPTGDTLFCCDTAIYCITVVWAATASLGNLSRMQTWAEQWGLQTAGFISNVSVRPWC